ncbi:MAG: PilZ domain-containing protein [Candidatus Omnitrophota bacterium]
MVTNLEDRRRFPRSTLREPIRFQVKGFPQYSNAVTENISIGGLGFLADRFIAPSTQVIMEISVLSHILRPIGKISWSSPLPHSDRNRLGVEFMEMVPEEKGYLSDYLDMKMGKF